MSKRQMPAVEQVAPATTYGAIVGRTLVDRRNKAGIDQAQLAEAVGVNQSTWSRVERGLSALSIDHLRAAARALGETPGAILTDADFAVSRAERRGIQVLATRDTSSVDAGIALIGAAALGALVGVALSKK